LLVEHAGGNQSRAFFCHGAQKLFPAVVDERYVIEVDN
jgi:hypothetical protein